MAKLTLTDIAAGYDTATIGAANNALIEAAVENTLSRDGDDPNQMESNLDMNSYRIQNLPTAVANSEPITLAQAASLASISTAFTQENVGAVLYPASAAETAASVTPTNLYHPVGDLRRYGDLTTLGNGSADDTTAWAAMLSFSGNKYVPKPSSKYKIDQQTLPASDIYLFVEPGTTIETNSGYGTNDSMFNFGTNTPSRITIWAYGCTFQYDSKPASGEQRHIFRLQGCTDISIFGATAKDAGGDGFYVGLRDAIATRIYVRDCISDNSRRNGVSITSGRDVYFVNHISKTTNGTSPQNGYDIEPDADTVVTTELAGTLENINLVNCEAYDSIGPDFSVTLTSKTWPSDFKCDVKLSNCTSYGDKAVAGTGDAGFEVSGGVDEQGIVSFSNCHSFDARTNGIEIQSCRTPVVWLGGSVHNPNQAGGATTRNSSAVSIKSVSGTDGSTYGNTTIDGLHITDDDGNMTKCINIQTVSEATSVFQNLNISVNAHGIAATKRTYNQGGTRAAPINIRYTDDPVASHTANVGSSVTELYNNQLNNNTGSAGAYNFQLDGASSQYIGNWYEFEVTAAQDFTVKGGAGTELLPDNVSTLVSSTIGSKLRVEWDGSNWQITNRIGTWGAQTYTPTNVSTDRAYDADTVAVAELADVVGTLIADLQAQGLLK